MTLEQSPWQLQEHTLMNNSPFITAPVGNTAFFVFPCLTFLLLRTERHFSSLLLVSVCDLLQREQNSRQMVIKLHRRFKLYSDLEVNLVFKSCFSLSQKIHPLLTGANRNLSAFFHVVWIYL